ncbi:MAG: hypothetical protein V3U98_06110 [Acidobacteriota bacterium]
MTIPEIRQRHWVVLALLASAVPWFRSALVGSRVLYFRDLLQNLYPWRRFWAAEVAQWRWPLWDPYASGGVPYLANPNTLSLYPLSWLQGLLPFDLAFNWLLIGTWLLGEAGAYRLGRRLGLDRVPAVLTAIAYGGSGYLISALNLPNLLLAAAAAPWVCWAALGLARRASSRDAALLGVSVALCALGGEPVALGVTLGASGLMVGLGSRGGAPLSRRSAVGVAGVALSLLLAAPLVLPAMELVVNSERGEGLAGEERTRWALDMAGVGEMFLPRFGGEAVSFDPSRYWSQTRHAGTMPLLVSLYAGVPLLTLAGLGWGSLNRRNRLLVGAGLLLCLALAAGIAGPLIQGGGAAGSPAGWLRYPSKFVIGIFCALAVLAGRGLQRLIRLPVPGRAAPIALLALSAVLAILVCTDQFGGTLCERWAASIFSLPPQLAQAAAPGLRRSLAIALLLCGATVLLLGPLRSRLRPPVMAAAWILLVSGDLWAAQINLVPTAPAEALRLRTFFAGSLQPEARIFREERPSGFQLRARDASRLWGFLFDRATLARHTSSEARLVNLLERPTDRLWPASTARLGRWVRDADGTEKVSILRRTGAEWWISYGEAPPPGVDEVAVAHGVSLPPPRLWRVRDPLPRVFFAPRVAVAQGGDAIRRGLSSSPVDVWVEAEDGGAVLRDLETPGVGSPSGTCSLAESTTDQVRLRCTAEVPGVAVLLDADYPGWEVRVDGVEMDSLRVNGAFRGVHLQPGRHDVIWRFRPFSVQLGRAFGLLGLIGALVLGFRKGEGATKSVNRC